jgi:magnesium-transporting ATPase (P-type)
MRSARTRALIKTIQSLGIKILMVTGDTVDTAKAISHQVGLGDRFEMPRAAWRLHSSSMVLPTSIPEENSGPCSRFNEQAELLA